MTSYGGSNAWIRSLNGKANGTDMSCHKIKYATKQEAADDAKLIRAQQRWFNKKCGKSKKSGQKLRIYKCWYCGMYHITTQKRRK